MKHIVWAVIAAAFIFTATESYARGFSVGVFGAYSIDGGPIEDTINDKKFIGDLGTSHYNYSRYDTLVIPGAGVFTVYTFSSGLSIRTGAEFYKMVSGGEISKSINGSNNKYDISYDAFALPVLVGYTLSPDKGRTCLYIYTGVALSIVKTNIFQTTTRTQHIQGFTQNHSNPFLNHHLSFCVFFGKTSPARLGNRAGSFCLVKAFRNYSQLVFPGSLQRSQFCANWAKSSRFT